MSGRIAGAPVSGGRRWKRKQRSACDWREEGGAGSSGRAEVEHEDDHRVLVRAVFLLPTSADCEVTVLERFSFPPIKVAVNVAEQLSRVPHGQLGHVSVPEFSLLRGLHNQLHSVYALEKLI